MRILDRLRAAGVYFESAFRLGRLMEQETSVRTFDFIKPVEMADAMSVVRAALEDEGLTVKSGPWLRKPWIVRVDTPMGPVDRLCLPNERIGVAS